MGNGVRVKATAVQARPRVAVPTAIRDSGEGERGGRRGVGRRSERGREGESEGEGKRDVWERAMGKQRQTKRGVEQGNRGMEGNKSRDKICIFFFLNSGRCVCRHGSGLVYARCAVTPNFLQAAGAPLHEGVAASNDGALMLYALYRQATEGNCNMEQVASSLYFQFISFTVFIFRILSIITALQPSMWAVTEYAKYKCWNAIKDMNKMQVNLHKFCIDLRLTYSPSRQCTST